MVVRVIYISNVVWTLVMIIFTGLVEPDFSHYLLILSPQVLHKTFPTWLPFR